MGVRKLKPTTPGQRKKIIGTHEDVTTNVPEKSLVVGKRSTGEALECAWPAVFYGDVEVSGGLTLGGQALADALWPVGCVRLTAEDTEPQPSPEGAEWERVDCGMAGIYAWRRIT